MLWRAHFEPQVLGESPWELPDGVYCGAGSVRALVECQIWLKLLASTDFSYSILMAGDPTGAEDVLPPSQMRKLRPVGVTDLVPAERAFGLVISPSRTMLVIGPPTEDVWEEFQSITP